MLEFSDQPYQFFPPRPNASVTRLAHWANQTIILPGPNHRISEIELSGAERLEALAASGAKLLLLPNHPTHSDPQVMSEVHRRLGLPSCFMAAYDVFLRSKFNAWMMQRTGSFSVDRDGSDRKAMSTAIDVLQQRGSVTIFPEGNVHFTNDRPTAFLDGAAFVGLKAQKNLGGQTPVYAVPVAIKATHLTDQRAAVLDRLALAAEIIDCHPLDRDADPLLELRRIGQLTLEKYLTEHDYEIPNDDQSIHDALGSAAETVIKNLEDEIEQSASVGTSLIERLRKVRSKIHQIRIAPEKATLDPTLATGWADRAILASRMLGYTGSYVAENPTLDRFAETAEKLIEDLRSQPQKPYGKRRAIVELCEPLDLREFSGRSAVSEVTQKVENSVLSALDRMNATNGSLGGQLFEK